MVKFALTLTILLGSIHLALFAQREVKGLAYDKDTRKPLEGATVLLFTAEKSILKGQSQSDKAGNFEIKNVPAGNFMLTISYMGYTAATIPLSFTEKVKVHTLSLQQTGLTRNAITLAGISIKLNKPIFTIRKDTIEFSAGDFQTAENASMKNLLQKIPGLTVDANGKFFYMGKQIHELYIDGRAVFQTAANSSGDPQKISQLLQANLVDKIQIADKKGLDGLQEGGKNEKVINITIKKELKKGINGSIGAGYGSDDHYNIAGAANMFRDNKQIITNVIHNNINTSTAPSSTDENQNQLDNFGGIMTKTNARGNISIDLTKKTKLTANYWHNDFDMRNNQLLQRDNILPDSNFRYNNSTRSTSNSSFNVLYGNVVSQPNDNNIITMDFMGDLGRNDINSNNNYTSLGGKNNDTINFGNIFNKETRKRNSFNTGGSFIHTFSKELGSANFNMNIEQNNTRNNQNNYSLNSLQATNRADTIDQKLSNRLNVRKINLGAGYQYPISNGIFLSAGYKYSNAVTESNQQAFDFDNIKRGYDILNKPLTYDFRNRYTIHIFSTGIVVNKNKLQGQLQLAYNTTSSVSNNYTEGKEYRQRINYFAPNISMTYKINNYKSLNLFASRDTRIPNTGTSMLPVISIQNPLYIQLGNPDLKPTINNSGNISYQSFSVDGLTFNTDIGFNLPENETTASISSDSSGKQISMLVNTNGNYDITHSIALGKRFSKSGLTLNYFIANRFGHAISFVNEVRNTTSTFTSLQSLNGSWTYKKLLEIEGAFNVQYMGNSYSIQDNRYYDYTNYSLSTSANLFLPLNFNYGASVTYYNNTNQRQQYVVVNTWISKTFLPDKSLLVKIYVYDLFRENQALLTLQTLYYIEQQRNTVLSRYGLLSATWFFGKKKAAAAPGPRTL
ncbi:MAG: outer membrane beta-barrel protein [Chitinophaga sp.]|uniref:outer membrane beta-barrel protein n=1 Tax=Chitinophaga sp. TaxID=1869181 RepID=UPI001B10BCD7|nr:outer membrane beta-barrel protein [Chitinophaga sp.]MBO9730096.1 outer membrane beta-barrel protein [Chitinophaga sp.]